MNKSDLALFSAKEQKLLLETEAAKLEKLSEDQLVDLLGRVRRARNKYSDLHRRQGAKTVKQTGSRAATSKANQRTQKQGELFEDAVSRVARYVSREARAHANQIKAERIAASKKARKKKAPANRKPKSKKRPAGTKSQKRAKPIVQPARVGATSAHGRRSQSKKDRRNSKGHR